MVLKRRHQSHDARVVERGKNGPFCDVFLFCIYIVCLDISFISFPHVPTALLLVKSYNKFIYASCSPTDYPRKTTALPTHIAKGEAVMLMACDPSCPPEDTIRRYQRHEPADFLRRFLSRPRPQTGACPPPVRARGSPRPVSVPAAPPPPLSGAPQ